MSAEMPFDRLRLRRRRARIAPGFAGVDFLKRAMAGLVDERLLDINRSFTDVLDLGCHQGWPGGRPAQTQSAQLVSCDSAMPMLAAEAGPRVVADEELLPFAPASFELVVSAGALHWVNDLPGCLTQIRQLLRPDGFFIAAFIGGDSLYELRAALMQAELEIVDGARARVAPMVDVRDAGSLLQRAGFAMPVAEVDRLTVLYAHPLALMQELRAMGESNMLRDAAPLRRDVLAQACALYTQKHGRDDGRIAATFSLITIAGWAPSPHQPKALRPGSAKVRLADALGAHETPLGRDDG